MSLWLLAILFGVGGVYVLSVGPAVFIYQKFELQGHWTGTALAAFYDPVFNLAEKYGDTYPARLFDSYVSLCAVERTR